MNAILNVLAEAGAGIVANYGESKFEVLLKKLHDTQPEVWEACVKSGNDFFKPLKTLAAETDTHVDDKLVEAFHTGVINSAKEFGLEL